MVKERDNVQVRFTTTQDMFDRVSALTKVLGLPSTSYLMATAVGLGVSALEEQLTGNSGGGRNLEKEFSRLRDRIDED